MAPPPGTLRVGRYFAALLALFAVLYVVVMWPGHKHTPKLGIDLVGGREVIFQAHAPQGKTPTSSQMDQAKKIMENRVNSTGVTLATVVVQGDDQLDIQIPGGTGTDVDTLGRAAVLNFRPLVTKAVQITCTPAAAKKSGSSGAPAAPSSGANGFVKPRAAPTPTPKPKASGSAKNTASPGSTPSGSASASAAPSATPCVKDPFGALLKAQSLKLTSIPATEADYKALSADQKSAINAALANYDCSATRDEPDLKNRYYVACDSSGLAYLLGKIIVPGSQIDNASAQAPSQSGQGGLAEWSVRLELKGKGADAWASWTGKYNTGGRDTGVSAVACGTSEADPCSDVVAFTLDSQVITAPTTNDAINHQPTSITGSFDQDSAKTLAQQLNYGALPLNFDLLENNPISATLGKAQLKAGLLAGGIGLILVVLYSLAYYRGLGLVTIASLLVSGGLTYAMLVVLGKQIGFTLDLAGIAGFIVAIGITADSFVVFFERIKDEVHEGRSVRVAVPRAWVRARRTILSADTVSFLAAAILYYFAAGDVRGFAFTLGLSTILDLVVVFWFTHPLVSYLSRFRAFGSRRFTGLSNVRAGGIASYDEETVRPKRTVARTSSEPKHAKPAKPARQRAATAVLEKDEPVEEPDEPVDEAEEADESADESAEEVHERRHTTPQAGSAAERAAARRARLREHGGDSDRKGGGN